jgi:cyclohexadienyl dehydratase
MDDLASHGFDLAASGISATAERRSAGGAFSVPYAFDGKVPIARRADAARFSSLDGIDQPGVRVIVNPGGTNERFVRQRIHRATIVLHAGNETIFDELAAGRADVMITDGAEARLQEGRHPELAITMTAPLTRDAKALLLPQGSDLTPRVDAWLRSQGHATRFSPKNPSS